VPAQVVNPEEGWQVQTMPEMGLYYISNNALINTLWKAKGQTAHSHRCYRQEKI